MFSGALRGSLILWHVSFEISFGIFVKWICVRRYLLFMVCFLGGRVLTDVEFVIVYIDVVMFLVQSWVYVLFAACLCLG